MVDIFGSDNSRYAREHLVETPVGQLAVGMFVAELDRPWLGTPFLLQGFEIRSKSQIRTLKDYCHHVYILKPGVPRLGPGVLAPKIEPPLRQNTGALLPSARLAQRPPPKRTVVRSRPAYEAQKPVRLEHEVARQVLDAGRVNVKSLLRSAHLGQMLDTDVAEATVDACVHSILRNPEALLWMSRIKNQNEYTAEHCLNVCVLAIAFGRHLKMSEEELRLLGLCGLLHDVGKMRIPTEILDKPGKLTGEEFEVMKQHTVSGHLLLQDQADRLHHLALDVALNHHERPDGRGYPRGLGAREIAEFTRIISVVDTYDAITSNRCYAPEQPSADAQRIIFENRGTQFDEEVALQFIRAIGPYPPGTLVELRNGMAGIVLAGKLNFRHLPTVLLLRDENKQPTEERTVELDLTDTGELSKEFLIRRTVPDGSFGIWLREYRVQHETIFL
jgi:HD-GYP domain-containing protein (c-di-GMP phosphodiesterase class II)